MTRSGRVTGEMVLDAMRELHEEFGGRARWPTDDELVERIGGEPKDVQAVLSRLRLQRIVTYRHRLGTEQWMPWGEA